MNREGALIARVLIHVSAQGWRLFRNSKGGAWQGTVIEDYKASGRRRPIRVVLLHFARFIKFGLLVDGSSDLVGWRPVRITPEMVGKTIAQFAVCELKTKGVVATDDQRNFVARVRKAGGYAAIVRELGMELVFDEGGKK